MVENARKSIAEGSNGVLIQSPPGSGKSVVIATIAKMATDKKNHVLFIVHRKELVEQIEKTFNRQQVDNQYTTIMTVGRVANRLGKLPYPSIIITDETHHSRAKTYRKIYDHYLNSFRLGFTATPWRMNGKGFTDIYDEMIKGKEVDWLIDNKFLAPFDYYAPTLADLEKLKTSSTGDYTQKSMDDAVSNAIFGDVVEHYKELANGRKAILYAHSVEASKRLAETFKEKGIEAIHADSKTPQKERDEIMDDFRDGKIPVLCNVDLISEGFDVPDCSCVILVRPTASLVLHLQQSMRSMRYQEGKKAIIIDHVANYAKHGLPNTEHKWTIKGRPKKKKRNNDALPIKHCPKCQMVNHSKVKECVGCGYEFKAEQSEKEQIDANLKKIDVVKFKTDYRKIRIKQQYAKKKVEELETLEDFYLFAMSRNYKLGWIKFQYAPLKNADFVTLHSKLKPIEQKYQNIFN
jgi:superfamily II DNA or RNA helicase